MNNERIPFEVVATNSTTLVEQVQAGLVDAIQTGYYRAGDVLPGVRCLAKNLGVSDIVTRAAIRRLARAGYINPRPRVGSVVLRRDAHIWKGRVLFVCRASGINYYVNAFTAAFRAKLAHEGWAVNDVAVSFDSRGRADLSELRLLLAHHVDLALVLFDQLEAVEMLGRAKVPFVVLGDREKPYGQALGYVRYLRGALAGDLTAEAVRAGVKRVLCAGAGEFHDITPELVGRGIAVEEIVIHPGKGVEMPDAFSTVACREFLRRLDSSRWNLPDLVYFSDDYICAGALAAFAEKGVRVPEDVKVVSWMNRGNAPAFAKKLTAFEMDPFADAAAVSDFCLACLENRNAPLPILKPRYVKGETL